MDLLLKIYGNCEEIGTCIVLRDSAQVLKLQEKRLQVNRDDTLFCILYLHHTLMCSSSGTSIGTELQAASNFSQVFIHRSFHI